MPKEMIVSLNGREKKIAIIENGRVTEFYIERGEGGQGIVGNIYKGRVMRVLPGMQSAFVDIGLDRDAFLYVSDFFDEEEEFERIVVDKKKSEGADDEAAQRAASERIERQRVERERQMEAAHESAEPEDEAEGEPAAVAASERDEPVKIEASESAPERAPEQAAGVEEEGGRRGRGRRRSRRGEKSVVPESASGEVPPGVSLPAGAASAEDEGVATPFVASDDSFERIVDEEEVAAENGSMFKDARLQERLSDQTRAVEFDMEPTATAEVGSLLGAGAGGGAGFERIEDSDAEATGDSSRLRSVQPEVAASVAGLVEEVEAEDTFARAQDFQRVSDDDSAVEAPAAGKKRGKADAAGRASSKKGASKGAKKSAARTEKSAATEGTEEPAATDERPAPKKRAAGASKSASKKGASKGGSKASASKASASKGSSKRGKKAASEGEQAGDADADASVTSRPARGEFARRGGRRRRKPGGKSSEEGQANGQNGDAEVIADEGGDAVDNFVADIPEVEAAPEPQQQTQPQPTPPSRPREQTRSRQQSSSSRQSSRGPSTSSRETSSSRESSSRQSSRESSSRSQSQSRSSAPSQEQSSAPPQRDAPSRGRGRESEAGGRGRRERHPMITDLLREGQEIIVQIAKEPIAQKGARITSHIALPGRFLVYMPTIEHVGVSRKIESDAERVRLRKLIQAIVREEDVPSGGFIVRTAGVGISEQDLRDDARYLIRTWRDIRRGAERAKAPSLAHKDLDLVQRLLRDQLSDDFTAIRVDSEEEYLEVVEFVNRIQPRLVNRVKLHTREEPILEAYGVQAEIDKAIKPRVWLKSGGYLVINQTEALVAIDVNTGKFVGRGGSRLEDTITRTNMEAVEEIARQIRLRDLGGILVLDLIDMEERRNRARVMQALQDALRQDKSPTKVLSFNDFGLVIMTRKRVKQSLERTLCAPCPYCVGAGLVKSPQTVCYEILEEARSLARANKGEIFKQTTLRLNPEVSRALRTTERDVLAEIEDYLGPIDITADDHVHQEQFDFAFI
ncbi:MAG TPA: Rne/Rng family ribonuclease [Pyrinomonadaceae bacterium]|nr:Rne/Rng family ribonuclease [Pyrinomonadaceae bacterium]